MNRWVKFWKLAPVERRLLFGALGDLLAVRVGLRVLPLQRILTYSKRLQAQTSEVGRFYGLPESSVVSVHQIAWAIRTVGRYLPGGGNCLVKSLAGHFMLARRGYASQLQIGAARDDGQFKAHAWVECEGQIVIGAAGVSQYTPFPNLEYSRQ